MSLGALFGPSRQLTMVTDHTMDVVSQFMLIRDVFDTTCMYFVSSAFFLPKMASKLELTPINPMLDYVFKNEKLNRFVVLFIASDAISCWLKT